MRRAQPAGMGIKAGGIGGGGGGMRAAASSRSRSGSSLRTLRASAAYRCAWSYVISQYSSADRSAALCHASSSSASASSASAYRARVRKL